MSRWDSAEILVEIVNAGSFTEAARRLNISKSHVSRQINQLESRLGVQLLNRSTRKLALTEMGKVYHQRCKEMISGMDEADQAVMDLQATPRGLLRLTVAGAFGERYVAPAAVSFMQAHPQLSIELDFTNRTTDLVDEGYDLAIRAGVLSDSSLIARRVATRRLYICGSRDYFSRYGKPDSLTSLRKHNCLIGSLPHWRFRQPDGNHIDIKMEGSWRSNNGHALLQAVRCGLGITQLPEFYLQDDIDRGSIEVVMQEFQPRDTAEWAVYPSNRHLSPKVRMFVEHLINQFKEIDYLT